MQEIWFNGTKGSKEDREKVKQDVALAHNAFKRMKDILEKKHKNNLSTDYDKASWPFLQADTNGYNRALQEVLKLIGD
jgi:hypothetical protein